MLKTWVWWVYLPILALSLAYSLSVQGDQNAAEYQLPPLETAPATLSEGLRVHVRGFRIEGSRWPLPDELKTILAGFQGRFIASGELLALQQRINHWFQDHGYINTGVLLPDQRVHDGIVVLHLVEGRITDIEVEGTERLRPGYIRERLALGIEQPFRPNPLYRQLQLLQEDPLLAHIDAHLQPGRQPGEARLLVRVRENQPYHLTLSLDNNRSPSLGARQASLEASHINLSGRGDRLWLRFALAEGSNNGAASYSLPLTATDARLTLEWENSDTRVIEAPFDAFDLATRYRRIGTVLSLPVVKDPGHGLDIRMGLERKESRTSLLGQPFSFSAGLNEGESTVNILRLGGDWRMNHRDWGLSARLEAVKGLGILDATLHPELPDGRFLNWLGQLQAARRLGEGRSLHLRAGFQLAGESLLPTDMCALGGMDSVRGYRANLLVTDNCISTSLEARVPLPATDNSLMLSLFADAGKAWSDNGEISRFIVGVGIGLRWRPSRGILAELYAALPLEKVEVQKKEPQDRGIHFRLTANLL